jgi:hypothetical protein
MLLARNLSTIAHISKKDDEYWLLEIKMQPVILLAKKPTLSDSVLIYTLSFKAFFWPGA